MIMVPYNRALTTGDRVFSQWELAAAPLSGLALRVDSIALGFQTMNFQFGHSTYGEFVKSMCFAWNRIADAGEVSAKGYDAVVSDLNRMAVAHSEPKIHDGVIKTKEELIRYKSQSEFNSADLTVLAIYANGICRAHTEVSSLLIAHLKSQMTELPTENASLRHQVTELSTENAHLECQIEQIEPLRQQLAELAARISRVEQVNYNLQYTNGQLTAKLDMYAQGEASKKMAMVQFGKVAVESRRRCGRVNVNLKRENAHLKQETAKVIELDKNLALTKQSAELQEQIAELNRDKAMLARETELKTEFDQLLQTKLREQKEKYQVKIRKIKAERKMYKEQYLRSALRKSTMDDISDSFTAI
jgi:chromosome segregation ATPase